MCKTHEPVIRCSCGEVIHEGEMCESCQKEQDVRTIEDSIDALFLGHQHDIAVCLDNTRDTEPARITVELSHSIDDDEFDKSREHADEMRHMGMGR
jgi:hypothetical protein